MGSIRQLDFRAPLAPFLPQHTFMEFRQNMPVGYEPDSDGFRGHVFASPDNGTVVLAIKGTSTGFIGGGGPTTRKDKLNDNLLFSCCCARVDWTWTTVCGCYRGGWKCDQDCVEKALIEDSLFYPIGTVSRCFVHGAAVQVLITQLRAEPL